jgi:hypothetical protein
LSAELLEFANEERYECEHDGCLLFDGIVRDCARKIEQAALQWRHERYTEEHLQLRNESEDQEEIVLMKNRGTKDEFDPGKKKEESP